MKLIILNRRRIGVTAIIIGLMLILFGVERNFDERLKGALMHSTINGFKSYSGLNKTFNYMLPQDWDSSEENNLGGEIIYNNQFTSKDQSIHGFVQVWNFKGDLKKFLENSKESAFNPKGITYKIYSMSPININKLNGYLLNFTQDIGSGNYYKGFEYFLSNDDKFFRFSFFVRESKFKETMPIVFENIVETMRYSK